MKELKCKSEHGYGFNGIGGELSSLCGEIENIKDELEEGHIISAHENLGLIKIELEGLAKRADTIREELNDIRNRKGF